MPKHIYINARNNTVNETTHELETNGVFNTTRSFKTQNFFDYLPQGSVDETSIDAIPSSSDKYTTGCLSNDGTKIYYPPYAGNRLGIFDIETETLDETYIVTKLTNGYYQGCVMARNNKMYCAPYSTSNPNILVFDTVNKTYELIPVNPRFTYRGVNLDTEGNVIMLPRSPYRAYLASDPNTLVNPQDAPFNDQVMKIIPETNTVRYFGDIGALGGQGGCGGGVLMPNGKIFCGYRGTNNGSYIVKNFLVVDPINETLEIVDVGPDGQNLNLRAAVTGGGGVLDQYSNVHMDPYETREGGNKYARLRVDTNTYQVTKIALPDGETGGYVWMQGGVMAPNGKIYFGPGSTNVDEILEVDPLTDTPPNGTSTPGNTTDRIIKATSRRFGIPILAPNGKLYFTPQRNSKMVSMKPGIPTMAPWMLQPEFNIF